MRNYCGVLVSREQYRAVFFAIEKKVVFNGSISNEAERERLWFMLGYSEVIVIVVARPSDDYSDLVSSEILTDIRQRHDLVDARVAYDYTHYLMFSRTERIRLCNLIRSTLSTRSNYRWCGAELEILREKNILLKSKEIIGLRESGYFVDLNGTLRGGLPWIRSGDFPSEIFSHSTLQSDCGQRKLCATFFAQLVHGTTLVYVGSSPGDGWLSVIAAYSETLQVKVISVDPRNLSQILDIPANVIHINRAITTASELLELVNSVDEAVLVWDARSDFDVSNKSEVVRRDIQVLNGILSDQRLYAKFKYLHLKVNSNNILLYALPEGGKFFPQPFTLDREIYEVRYIWHHSGESEINLATPSRNVSESLTQMLDTLRASMIQEGPDTINQQLIANYLISRVRTGDYLSLESNFVIQEEIFLFTINHNSPEKILFRLNELRKKGIRYFGSFFTGSAMNGDPFRFPEGEFLLNGLGVIFDSRSIINAKIESLYFFISDALMELYSNELQTSETHLIMSTEFDVLAAGEPHVYDEIRRKVSKTKGMIFPKFPEIFSLSDRLVSPSGHALRVAAEAILGRASLGMLALKILYNFRSVKLSNVRRFGVCRESVKLVSSHYRGILKADASSRKLYEKEKKCIWHSLEEWKLGIESALHYMVNDDPVMRSGFASIQEFLTKCIAHRGDGLEIENFLSKNPSLSPISERALRSAAPSSQSLSTKSLEHLFEDLFKYAARDKNRNWAMWSLRPGNDDEGMMLWRALVSRARIDAMGRDYYVHTSYMSALNPEYDKHDLSKTNWLEFVLGSFARAAPGNVKYPHLLHFFNNKHHPEYSYLRTFANGLEDTLGSLKTFREILSHLETLSLRLYAYEKDLPESYYADVDQLDYKEFLYDLLARTWQLDHSNYRMVNKEQLSRISSAYFLRPFVNQEKFSSQLRLFLANDDVTFSRLRAHSLSKSRFEWLYP